MSSTELPRPLRRVLVLALAAVLAFAAAALLVTLRPVNVVRCDAGRDCRIERWIGGVYFLYADELRAASQVTVESWTEDSTSRSGGHSRIGRSRVILHDKSGTSSIATDPVSYALGVSHDRIERDLAQFLATPSSEGYVAWQGEAALLLLCGALAVLGLGLCLAAVRKALGRPRKG
ncbi:MAG: hypothetical protein MUF10_09730 [Thermoanaerobaculaceae bacterium]|nr:hypothetical protein [Thermoanaerobaculaceae bacterium]